MLSSSLGTLVWSLLTSVLDLQVFLVPGLEAFDLFRDLFACCLYPDVLLKVLSGRFLLSDLTSRVVDG